MSRCELWILGLGLGGLAVSGVGGLLGIEPVSGLGIVLSGLGCVVSILRCHREGIIRTSRGLVRRADSAAWFRFQLGFWWLLTVLWTLGGLFQGLGLIGTTGAGR